MLKVERMDNENVYFSMDSSNGKHAGGSMKIAQYKAMEAEKPAPKAEPETTPMETVEELVEETNHSHKNKKKKRH